MKRMAYTKVLWFFYKLVFCGFYIECYFVQLLLGKLHLSSRGLFFFAIFLRLPLPTNCIKFIIHSLFLWFSQQRSVYSLRLYIVYVRITNKGEGLKALAAPLTHYDYLLDMSRFFNFNLVYIVHQLHCALFLCMYIVSLYLWCLVQFLVQVWLDLVVWCMVQAWLCCTWSRYGCGMVVWCLVQVWWWYGCVVHGLGKVVVWLCDTCSRYGCGMVVWYMVQVWLCGTWSRYGWGIIAWYMFQVWLCGTWSR